MGSELIKVRFDFLALLNSRMTQLGPRADDHTQPSPPDAYLEAPTKRILTGLSAMEPPRHPLTHPGFNKENLEEIFSRSFERRTVTYLLDMARSRETSNLSTGSTSCGHLLAHALNNVLMTYLALSSDSLLKYHVDYITCVVIFSDIARFISDQTELNSESQLLNSFWSGMSETSKKSSIRLIGEIEDSKIRFYLRRHYPDTERRLSEFREIFFS